MRGFTHIHTHTSSLWKLINHAKICRTLNSPAKYELLALTLTHSFSNLFESNYFSHLLKFSSFLLHEMLVVLQCILYCPITRNALSCPLTKKHLSKFLARNLNKNANDSCLSPFLPSNAVVLLRFNLSGKIKMARGKLWNTFVSSRSLLCPGVHTPSLALCLTHCLSPCAQHPTLTAQYLLSTPPSQPSQPFLVVPYYLQGNLPSLFYCDTTSIFWV